MVESEVWGEGLVTITHTCVNTDNIRQTCDQDTEQVRFMFDEEGDD